MEELCLEAQFGFGGMWFVGVIAYIVGHFAFIRASGQLGLKLVGTKVDRTQI